MKLSELKPNPKNPRLIKDEKFKKLCESIKSFPKMMELRPIVIDDQNIILGGNMRHKALQALGYTEIDDTWVKKASDYTEEEKREFIIKDNNEFGEWNFDALLNEFEMDDLLECGFNKNDFNINVDKLDGEIKEKVCPHCGHKLK